MEAFGPKSPFGVFVVACVAVLLTSMGVARLVHEGDGETATVQVTEAGFEPRSVEVEAGGTVVFENAGQQAHWPASDAHPTHTGYSGFDPKEPLQPGEEWSFTFDKPGKWGYHDHASPSLSGEVVTRPDASDGGHEGLSFFGSTWGSLSDVYGATVSVFAPEDGGPPRPAAETITPVPWNGARARKPVLARYAPAG